MRVSLTPEGGGGNDDRGGVKGHNNTKDQRQRVMATTEQWLLPSGKHAQLTRNS